MSHLPDQFWTDLDDLRKANRRVDNARANVTSYQQQADHYAGLASVAVQDIEQGEAQIEALIKKLNGYFATPESMPTGGEGSDPKPPTGTDNPTPIPPE